MDDFFKTSLVFTDEFHP